jgi:sortase A
VSPFHNLGLLCGAPLPAGNARRLPPPNPAPVAGGRADGKIELRAAYLLGFARVLLLGLLAFVGLLSLGVGAAVLFHGHALQASKAGILERAGTSRRAKASPSNAEVRAGSDAPVEAGLLARLEIPRLGFSAAVRDGMAPEVLKIAIGHIPGTALPGEPGNIGLTGHRDTFFRSLDGLQAGDLIRLTMSDRTHVYRVESVRIVASKGAELPAFDRRPALTLVTRYEFGSVRPSVRQLVVLSRPVS